MSRYSDVPVLKPWEVFACEPERQRRIFYDWAGFLLYRKQNANAEKAINNCLKIRTDAKALFLRSRCKRDVAQIKPALDDAKAAAVLDSLNPAINVEICEDLHYLNEFENAKAELHNNIQTNMKKKCFRLVKCFQDNLDVVNGNILDCLGEPYGHFVLKEEAAVNSVLNTYKRENVGKNIPRWKLLQEHEECDVLSIPDVKEIFLHPREMARRERWLKIYNQFYMGRSWVDIDFMHDLKKNDVTGPPRHPCVKPLLQDVIKPNYEVVKKFVKMLHSRSPLYNRLQGKYTNEKIYQKHLQNYLNFRQYQIRRSMVMVLNKIKEFRMEGKLETMCQYIEKVMADYVTVTDRLMPWKFEFVNEVYNTLALTHADKYPQNPTRQTVNKILNLSAEAERLPSFHFEKRETFITPNVDNSKDEKLMKLISRLEKRKKSATYSVERCYLGHEIARAFLKLGRYDWCCSTARQGLAEAKICNNNLWKFLYKMLVVKANASLHKIEACEKALKDALNVAKILKDERLIQFVKIAKSFNDDEIAKKRKTQSMDSMVKKRSITSQDLRPSESSIKFVEVANSSNGDEIAEKRKIQSRESILKKRSTTSQDSIPSDTN